MSPAPSDVLLVRRRVQKGLENGPRIAGSSTDILAPGSPSWWVSLGWRCVVKEPFVAVFQASKKEREREKKRGGKKRKRKTVLVLAVLHTSPRLSLFHQSRVALKSLEGKKERREREKRKALEGRKAWRQGFWVEGNVSVVTGMRVCRKNTCACQLWLDNHCGFSRGPTQLLGTLLPQVAMPKRQARH